ncbi:uncharacterized protein EV154DRAFT_559422 [Mucor mucedo]|nr:uncharacterized protein EV154DRAFT_559422 [Mucor mucedo]KAI7895320.1 hypothetical protein EV154DRAFT_559422 [Mucor mucedo]
MYGTVDTQEDGVVFEEQVKTWRHALGERLEKESFHIAVLCLVLLDAACVITQIVYTFFHECQVPAILVAHPEGGWFLIAFEMAEVISIIICVLFLVECTLSLVAFGPRYYLPGWPHWKLHVFDATVILTTLVLEVGLRGKEREVAGLLIVFRLWRVVKVVEAVILSVSFTHQEELDELKVAYAELETKLKLEEEKNKQLLNEL